LTFTRLLALCAFGLAGCSREVRGRVVDLHTIPYALVLTAARRDIRLTDMSWERTKNQRCVSDPRKLGAHPL